MVNSEYSLMVITLIAAIFISILFHIFTYPAEASFSEAYFGDNLPNTFDLNQSYNFSFSIANHEDRPKTYSYESKLELYNLYEVTEGVYKCSAKNRKKVIMEWIENGTELYTQSDDYGRIDWPYYSIQYQYTNLLEGGTFTTIFHDENEIYSFTIYEGTQEIEFNHSVRKKVELKPSNEILINATDGLRYYLNGEMIFNEKIDLPTTGKVDFSSTTLPSIRNLVVYKDSPVEVTQSKYIREYDIDTAIIQKKLEETRQDIELMSHEINITQEDTALTQFFSSSQDKFTINKTNINELLSSINTTSQFQSRSYLQNSSAEELSWKNYTINMDFQTFTRAYTFIIGADDFMILFHDADIFFIDDYTIQRIKSPVKVGANQLQLNSENNNLVVSVNDFPIFNAVKPLGFKNVSLYTKNTIMALSNIVLTKKGCNSQSCRRVYRIESEMPITQRRDIEATAEPIPALEVLYGVPMLGVAELFKEYTLLNSSASLLNYDIGIDPSLINEDISSEEYVFNGKNAIVANQGNYSFSFNFNVLEGIGLLEASFHNNDGKKIATIILSQPDNRLFLFTNVGSVSKKTAEIDMDPTKSHRLDIVYESGNAAYYFDGRKLIGNIAIDMSNGFFSISNFNTHSEIRDITLFDRNTRSRIPFSINADPCRLRKIKEIVLDKNYLYLDKGEKATIANNFTIDSNFDYGMVSVSMPDKEIHFWVTRND